MFDDRIVHQYIVNNPNDDELVRQLWSRSEDCVIPHRYYYSRPKKQTPEEFAAWAIENLRINVPMEVLAHGDRVTVVGDGRNGQDLTDVERWFIGYAQAEGLQPEVYLCDGVNLIKRDEEDFLSDPDIAEDIAQDKAERAAYTAGLTEIGLDIEASAPALWSRSTSYIHYSNIDLSFPLIRRIERWAEAYWLFDAIYPKVITYEEFEERHEKEAQAICEELRKALPHINVVGVRDDGIEI